MTDRCIPVNHCLWKKIHVIYGGDILDEFVPHHFVKLLVARMYSIVSNTDEASPVVKPKFSFR